MLLSKPALRSTELHASLSTRAVSATTAAEPLSTRYQAGFVPVFSINRQDYKDKRARELTFLYFPSNSPVDCIKLLKAGFYYTGDNDTTQCHICNVKYSHWKADDEPLEVHKNISPDCAYVNTCRIESDGADCAASSRELLPNCDRQSSVASDSGDETDGPLDSGKSASAQRHCRSSTGKTKQRNSRTSPSVLDKNALKEENKSLKSSMTCTQCKKEKVQTLYLPCRHLIACESCAERMDDCLRCNQKILGTVRIFLT